ncbi:hypothetical protein SprV_0902732400 [Sparganum proliferum]
MTAEAVLAFQQETLSLVVVQTVEKDTSEDLPSDVLQGNVLVVVADSAVPLPLVEAHYCGIFEILRDFSLTPHLLEERRQMIHELGATVLVDLNRGRVRSRCILVGELPHGPDAFLDRGREVEVDIGFHLRQTSDGGVQDVGGTVEDISEVLGPSLKDLCLLS